MPPMPPITRLLTPDEWNRRDRRRRVAGITADEYRGATEWAFERGRRAADAAAAAPGHVETALVHGVDLTNDRHRGFFATVMAYDSLIMWAEQRTLQIRDGNPGVIRQHHADYWRAKDTYDRLKRGRRDLLKLGADAWQPPAEPDPTQTAAGQRGFASCGTRCGTCSACQRFLNRPPWADA